MKKLIFLMIATPLLICDAGAVEAYFQSVPMYSSGAANIQEQNGGTYVYGAQKDFRKESQPIALEKNRKIYYELVTVQEEEALMQMKDKILGERLLKEQIRQRRAYLASVRKLDWPKVTIIGSEICVPTLASSESNDWKSDLTCYELNDSPAVEVVEDARDK